MTEENKKRVYDALIQMNILTPSIVAMIDTLAKISKEFTDGSGFEGDCVVKEAGRYLLGATAHLESASAGMLSKLQESKELIAKQEAEYAEDKKAKDAIPPAADRPSDCPAEGKECPMQREQAAKKVLEDDFDGTFRMIVCDQLGIHPDQCQPQASFVEDLGADELDPIELAMALECEFKICFTEAEVDGFSTYEKLYNLVKEKLAAKNNQVKEG